MGLRTYVSGSTTIPIEVAHQLNYSAGPNITLTNAATVAGMTIGATIGVYAGATTPPTDGQFTAAQLAVGMLYVDTTTPALWTRTAAATWKSVAVS